MAFNGSIYRIGAKVRVLRPGGNVFIGHLRVANLVVFGRLTSDHFLDVIFNRSFDFLRPVRGLLSDLDVRSPCFPSLLCCFSIFFRRATIRPMESEDFIFEVLRHVVGDLDLLLDRPIVMVTNQDRRRIFAVNLVRAFQRCLQVRSRKERFFGGLFCHLPLDRERLQDIGARRYLLRGLQYGTQGGLLQTVVIVGAIQRPRALRVNNRVRGIQTISIAHVVHVSHLGRPPSNGVMFSILVRRSVPSFRHDLDRVMCRLFLFRDWVLGSKCTVTWCLWIYGLFRYVFGVVYLDDIYFFNTTTDDRRSCNYDR